MSMSTEVGIKKSEFDSNVSSLQDAVSEIDSSAKGNLEFEKTNIKPFTKDLKTTVEAIELLENYKQMIINDITTLKTVGETMVETDEEIANSTHAQPIRP